MIVHLYGGRCRLTDPVGNTKPTDMDRGAVYLQINGFSNHVTQSSCTFVCDVV